MTSQNDFQLRWQGSLSDYTTAVGWLPNGETLVATSAAGEVVLHDLHSGNTLLLQEPTGQSIDCLAVSSDGHVATGGQNGKVQIWRLSSVPELITTLENRSVWVDRMAWSPVANQLALGLGRYVQVWDAEANEVVSTLNFAASTVLDIDWHPSGKFLALCGYGGAQVWQADHWDEDPQAVLIPSASVAIAWSHDGAYIADGNMDSTLTVLEWKNPQSPWIMRGFPGKVRQLAWSQPLTAVGAPLLASCSSESVVVWERDADETVGWASQVLDAHQTIVQAIAFQPQTMLLASAGADGIYLWHKAKRLQQVLHGVEEGFSCLSWQPGGQQLAAGGKNGEVLVWSQVKRGRGFGR